MGLWRGVRRRTGEGGRKERIKQDKTYTNNPKKTNYVVHGIFMLSLPPSLLVSLTLLDILFGRFYLGYKL